MLKYIFRRILLVIPTLFAILLISFMISRSVPGDPVYLQMDAQYREGSSISPELRDQAYKEVSHTMGLDLPLFYVDFTSMAYPENLHEVLVLGDRENLAEMIHIYGNWPEIEVYYKMITAIIARCRRLMANPDTRALALEVQVIAEELHTVAAADEINYRLQALSDLQKASHFVNDSLSSEVLGIRTAFNEVQAKATPWKSYVPWLQFHGFRNQFHNWFIRLLHLDFGKSNTDRRPVKDMIAEALPWTIFMGFFSYVIAYLIAIPTGVFAVRKRNHWQDRVLTIFLFLLTSVPAFVMAMLAMTFLCNPDYFQIFPTSGINSDGAEQWSMGGRLLDYAYHLTLPTLVFSYHGIAFISRQLRGSMMEMMHADYIRTAWAKGLPEKTVIWRHLLRNSILPIITHLAGLLPSLVAGGLIIETIFSVPGMGLLTIQAIGGYDHPVVIAVLTLTAVATLIGLLISDILLALVDPRISFEAK